jgi:hypothetical protein
MAALANVVINDSSATPVAKTYVPVSNSNDLTVWRENAAAGSLAGQPQIRLTSKLNPQASGMSRMRITVDLPAESALGTSDQGYKAIPKVDYICRATVDFILPNRSSAAQRKDLRVRLQNLLANALIVDAVDSVAPPF